MRTPIETIRLAYGKPRRSGKMGGALGILVDVTMPGIDNLQHLATDGRHETAEAGEDQDEDNNQDFALNEVSLEQ